MELVILLALIVMNGVFAMSEMAVVSSRKARLQQWADEGRPGAKVALALANEPSTFLSTIQVGITVIGITSGAFGEATLAAGLSAWLSQWPLLDPYSDTLALTLVVAGITVASLIVGELVPKRLALRNPEAVASVIAPPMRLLARIAHPVVRALSAATEGVLRLLGMRGAADSPVTEEEINVLMEQGAEAGVFQAHERMLVSRVFRLDELRVTGIMTPRSDIVYLDLEDPLSANIRRIAESSHSRLPVVRGGFERTEGVVLAKTLLADALSGTPVDLAARVQKPLFLPSSLTVMEVVEQFKRYRQTMAFVVNEYGEVQGLVTLNDVMEALVGDIATADEDGDRDVVQREDGSWLVDGGVTVERFRDILDVDGPLPGEDEGNYQTLGGFAMAQLGRVPLTGDKFRWDDLSFEIVDMDRNRVDKVIVARMTSVAPLAPSADNRR
jgi:putative hemolysin